jgi:KUP system potassium uptake protein
MPHSATPAAQPSQPSPSSEVLRSLVVLTALGVVFGDIGTSPLYALRESLSGELGAGTGRVAVLGVLSMIFWAITLVVSVKYVLLVMRADNDGEGGILALLTGVLRQVPDASPRRRAVIVAGLTGAAMFYGDSVITPAISVLSAIEGLEVVSPQLEAWVIPVTLAVLVALFGVQRYGTGRMGSLFGPVMVLWFAVLAVLGLVQIVRTPEVLHALSPFYALGFALSRPDLTIAAAGAVFLAVTGGEALYADLGHFGARPIRVAWFWIVMPALLLNYFGQGALVLREPSAAANPFFLLAPDSLQLPLVILSALATVIASQAVISGAFSLTAQAARLGYLPRINIRFTSATEAGQVYVPAVNWFLLAMVVVLVLGFKSSAALAAAYGIAVSITMVITVLGVMVIAARRWGWPGIRVLLVLGPLLLLDVLFVAANSLKIEHGGWFPLAFGALLLLLLTTWHRGRELLLRALGRGGLQLAPFVKSLTDHPPHRVEGTAVYMTAASQAVPSALLHNLKHNRVLHERVVLMTAEPDNAPHVDPLVMALVTELGSGFYVIKLRLGFHDSHDIHHIARMLEQHHGFRLDVDGTSFFLSRQTLIVQRGGGMAPWRKRLFRSMLRNAQPASDFFNIPPNRAIEIGTQVVI